MLVRKGMVSSSPKGGPTQEEIEGADASCKVLRVWITNPTYSKTLKEWGEEFNKPWLCNVVETEYSPAIVIDRVTSKKTGEVFDFLKVLLESEDGTQCVMDVKKKDSGFEEGELLSLDSIRVRKETLPGEKPHYYIVGDVRQ